MNIQCPNCKSNFDLEIYFTSNGSSVDAVCGHCNAKLNLSLTVKVETGEVFSNQRASSETVFSEGAKPPLSQDRGTPFKKEKVLVAIEGDTSRQAIVGNLTRAGFPVLEAAGGRDALDLLQKEKPAVVLLDVGLPQMFGFELCDIIKKSPLLKEIGVILVASIYDKTRYKRQPSTLYGADDFIERHQIEEELVSKINQLIKNEKNKEKKSISESDPIEQSPKKPIERGNISQSTDQSFEVKPMEELHPGIKSNLPVSPGENGLSKKEGIVLSPETSIKGENLHPLKGNAFPHEITLSEPAMKACTSAVTEIPQKEERKDNSSVHDGARRLARIIISDIALYNQKNVEAGLQKGKFSEVLKSELEEGKKLYQERVSPEIFNSTDYFEEAIQEFIAKRRAKVK